MKTQIESGVPASCGIASGASSSASEKTGRSGSPGALSMSHGAGAIFAHAARTVASEAGAHRTPLTWACAST